MTYYPLFADLTDRHVVVVGGGEVATRKTLALLKAQANVSVVAPTLNDELYALHNEQAIDWQAESYNKKQLNTAFLVIAATDDNTLNQQIFNDAEAQHTLVNVVDNQPLCSFIVPAVIDRSPIQIAITSGGTAPVLARLLRQRLEAELPQHLGKLAVLAGRFRHRVKKQLKTLTERRRFWETLFANPTLSHQLASNQEKSAETTLIKQLTGHQPKQGEVTLVGAGPGSSDLLTLGGLQAIQAADVVLYDALVSDEVMELVRRDAERIHVGKRAGKHHVIQEKTNDLLVHFAQQGKRVVRLKGGDPFIFGRGGEECQVLVRHGIDFRVIPGVTAAAGATAYAGIPLTHRDYAQSAVFITGHCQARNAIDWQALARSHQTLVIYMGTLRAKVIAQQLQQYGRAADTPIAVISKATTPEQSTFIGQLTELTELSENAPRPALIVIGEVVALHKELTWFNQSVHDTAIPSVGILNKKIS